MNIFQKKGPKNKKFDACKLQIGSPATSSQPCSYSSFIPMADLPPVAIVLAVGGAVVGGPEALRLLLALEGRTAATDVTVCAFLFCAFTALLLGTLLLARFFRDAHPGAGAPARAPGTERFARMTLAVAFAVLFLVTSCLLVVPSNLAGTGVGGVRSCSA